MSTPDEELDRFNQEFNREFLARRPWSEYPWNEAGHVRLNSVKTGTIVVTTPTENKYRTLPFQLTRMLQNNLDYNLIGTIWDFLKDFPRQFYLQPTWVLSLEAFGLKDFFEASFEDLLGDFSLDQNNNPNNNIGLLGWVREGPDIIILHFKLPDVNTAMAVFNEIIQNLESIITIYIDLLVYNFIQPLQETGRVDRRIFDEVMNRYQNNTSNFKVFVDEIIKRIPALKPFLNRSQYNILENEVIKRGKSPPLIQQIMGVVKGRIPLPR